MVHNPFDTSDDSGDSGPFGIDIPARKIPGDSGGKNRIENPPDAPGDSLAKFLRTFTKDPTRESTASNSPFTQFFKGAAKGKTIPDIATENAVENVTPWSDGSGNNNGGSGNNSGGSGFNFLNFLFGDQSDRILKGLFVIVLVWAVAGGLAPEDLEIET